MKNRISDNTLKELLEILIMYRQDLRSENESIHIGIKTQAGSTIIYIDNEDDAINTIKGLKKQLQIEEQI